MLETQITMLTLKTNMGLRRLVEAYSVLLEPSTLLEELLFEHTIKK